GADLRGLAELAAEIYTRSPPEDPDGGKDQAFEDRSVKLETTFGGAGVLSGDLTPARARDNGGGGAGCTVGPGRRPGHPHLRPALPRRAPGGDALAQNLHRDVGHIVGRVRHEPQQGW